MELVGFGYGQSSRVPCCLLPSSWSEPPCSLAAELATAPLGGFRIGNHPVLYSAGCVSCVGREPVHGTGWHPLSGNRYLLRGSSHLLAIPASSSCSGDSNSGHAQNITPLDECSDTCPGRKQPTVPLGRRRPQGNLRGGGHIDSTRPGTLWGADGKGRNPLGCRHDQQILDRGLSVPPRHSVGASGRKLWTPE